MTRTMITALAVLTLLSSAPERARSCERQGNPDRVELGTVMKGIYLEAYGLVETKAGTRVMPEKEYPFYYEVTLVPCDGSAKPADFDARAAALETSLKFYLLPYAIERARVTERGRALEMATPVPIDVSRIEQSADSFAWIAWRVHPHFETVLEPLTGSVATFSLSSAPIRAYLDPALPTEVLATSNYQVLVIRPAQSTAETLSRELSDVLMAQDATNWASMLRHAEAMIAIDTNCAFGHAYRARALSELGQQGAAEVAMRRADEIIATGADTRLVQGEAWTRDRRTTKLLLARALCPVLARSTTPAAPDPRCDPSNGYRVW